MEPNVFFVLFLCIYSIFALERENITDRLAQIEDTLRNERELRQEMNEEVNSIKMLLQDGKVNTFVSHNFLSDLKKGVTRLLKGFVEEKTQNKELKQEITGIKRHVQELDRKTDKISAILTECVKNTDSLKDHVGKMDSEIAENYTQIQKDIHNIKDDIEEVQRSLISDAESLNDITNDMLEMKEKIEHMQNFQEKSTLGISKNQNIVSSITKENEVIASYNGTIPASTVAVSTLASKPTQMTAFTKTIVTMRKSCLDLFYNERKTFNVDGVYDILSDKAGTISVYCDMTTDGGGWTVFQRREDGSVNFYRDWNDYKTGFGNLTGEFWFGNEYLNILTDNDEPHKLRIELKDHEGNHAYAKYHNFKIGPESMNYRLQLNDYTGTAGDSLEKSLRGQKYQHDGMEFSTFDRDNDKSNGSCAVDFKGGWWYNSCFESNLNSLYQDQTLCDKPWVCIIWNAWRGSWYSLNFTEMKFR